MDEIAGWLTVSDEQRREIMDKLPERLKQLQC